MLGCVQMAARRNRRKHHAFCSLLLGSLLGIAVQTAVGKTSGYPAGAVQRIQSEDDPEPGQEPEENRGNQPGVGSEEPGAPKPPSDPPFVPGPYFPEIPQFQMDEPYVP